MEIYIYIFAIFLILIPIIGLIPIGNTRRLKDITFGKKPILSLEIIFIFLIIISRISVFLVEKITAHIKIIDIISSIFIVFLPFFTIFGIILGMAGIREANKIKKRQGDPTLLYKISIILIFLAIILTIF